MSSESKPSKSSTGMNFNSMLHQGSQKGRFFIGLMLVVLAGYLYLEKIGGDYVVYGIAGIGLLLIILSAFGNHHMHMRSFGIHMLFSKTSLVFLICILSCIGIGYYFSYIVPKLVYVILSGVGLVVFLFLWKLYFSFASHMHKSHLSHAFKFMRR
jgi:hypothetical protein